MALNQDGVNFPLCPKQGMYFGNFLRLTGPGPGFKSSAAHLYPNIARVPLPPPGGWSRSTICIELHCPPFSSQSGSQMSLLLIHASLKIYWQSAIGDSIA